MALDQRLLPILIAVLGVLGLAVCAWVFWPAFRGREEARKDIGTHRLVLGGFVAFLAINVALVLPLQLLLHLERGITAAGLVLGALTTDIAMLAFLYFRLVRPGAVTWTELGLRPLRLGHVVRVGLAAGLVGLVVTFVVGTLLSQVGLQQNQSEQFRTVLAEGPLAFAALFIAAGIVAPIVEELFFRGFVFGLYRRRKPLWEAYLISVGLFTVLHIEPYRMDLSQMAALSVGIAMLALLLTWLYQHTGSLYPGILAHAVNNATGLILLYVSDKLSP